MSEFAAPARAPRDPSGSRRVSVLTVAHGLRARMMFQLALTTARAVRKWHVFPEHCRPKVGRTMHAVLCLAAATSLALLGCSRSTGGGIGARDGAAGEPTGDAGRANDAGVGMGGRHGNGDPAPVAGAGGGGIGSGGRTGSGGDSVIGATGGAAAAGTGGMPERPGGTTGRGGEAGGGGAAGTTPRRGLGLNDVTILVPLPGAIATPVILRAMDLAAEGTALVPRALFDRIARDDTGRALLGPDSYGRLHLVAVRFDLCDRQLPGPCPETEDARLRLVFQPLTDLSGGDDVGFHAFYAIANAEIGGAVTELRDLATTSRKTASEGPLSVSPALSAGDDEARLYAGRLRAFVTRYAGETRLVRLTVNAQPVTASQVRWLLRGVEKKGDAFVDIPMVGSAAIAQSVILSGVADYNVTPLADLPPGLAGVVRRASFDTADASTQRAYLAALAAVDNPLSHTAETVPCAACHVSTVVMHARASAGAIDPLSLPGRYTSKLDLSVAAGKSPETDRTLRALGYLARQPMISQRAVNESAQTLAEIERRYPSF